MTETDYTDRMRREVLAYRKAQGACNIVSAQRQRSLLDATFGAACVIDTLTRQRRRERSLLGLCLVLAYGMGVGVGALLFV